jgi:radical SAM protein with 4Fe4S-binding SPASM domain
MWWRLKPMNKDSINRITFQWHITDICNFRCKHCYQDEYNSKGLTFIELTKIFAQLRTFVINKKIKRAHINITGGEPFLREDLLDLIDEIKKSEMFSFGILTNGYLPTRKTLNKLKLLNPKFIQISLEGKKKTNDSIRGVGTYDKILESLKAYRKLRIPTMISFTANANNYMDYPHIVKIAKRNNAFKVWTDRYLPYGKTDNLQISTEQFRKLGELIIKEKRKAKFNIFTKTDIAANRALQFLFCGDRPYSCSAGESLFAILSNGDLLPCRRLPIRIGNLLTDNLNDLKENSEILKNILSKDNLDKNCSGCFYKTSCRGGLKCLSYAMTGDYNRKDLNCLI